MSCSKLYCHEPWTSLRGFPDFGDSAPARAPGPERGVCFCWGGFFFFSFFSVKRRCMLRCRWMEIRSMECEVEKYRSSENCQILKPYCPCMILRLGNEGSMFNFGLEVD